VRGGDQQARHTPPAAEAAARVVDEAESGCRLLLLVVLVLVVRLAPAGEANCDDAAVADDMVGLAGFRFGWWMGGERRKRVGAGSPRWTRHTRAVALCVCVCVCCVLVDGETH
jgi:hypothetical protein